MPLDYKKQALDNPLPEVSFTSLVLGVFMGLAIAMLIFGDFKPLYVYVILVTLFHFLEYYVTARYQPSKVTATSFLINNGVEYLVAHGIALAEVQLELSLFPSFKRDTFIAVKVVGLLIALAGQYFRTIAMVSSGENFSHRIEETIRYDHFLVQSGIYGVFRHPAYAGFFYWALGTQLLLLNPISFVLFLVLLYRFFRSRIDYEEYTLVRFFGRSYIEYRKHVPSGIPFL